MQRSDRGAGRVPRFPGGSPLPGPPAVTAAVVDLVEHQVIYADSPAAAVRLAAAVRSRRGTRLRVRGRRVHVA